MSQEYRTDQSVTIPDDLPILPLRNTVVFPFAVIPLMIGRSPSVRLVDDVSKSSGERLVGLIAAKDGTVEEPKPNQPQS